MTGCMSSHGCGAQHLQLLLGVFFETHVRERKSLQLLLGHAGSIMVLAMLWYALRDRL